jgi:DNA-3-methyladenine glycosylase
MNILPVSWFQTQPTLEIAEKLLGKLLISQMDGQFTSGRIVETEAYLGIEDRASHAYGNRRTARTEVLFGAGGQAYVYLCYGLHHLLNVVTQPEGIPHAVLLRGIEPIEGIDEMLLRRGKKHQDASLSRGPGNLSKAFGIQTIHNRQWFSGPLLSLADDGFENCKSSIGESPRIGVEYAGEDALLPFRFFIKGNPSVSGKNI